MDDRHLLVVGAMASGKSTIGRLLAARLGRPLRDSDDDLVSEQGISGRQLADRRGVDALHQWEADHLLRVLAAAAPAVVTPAASVVDDAGCRAAMADHVVIWLRVPPSVLAARLAAAADDHRRRVAGSAGDLAVRREPAFRSVADITVDVGERSADDVADELLSLLPPSVLPRPPS